MPIASGIADFDWSNVRSMWARDRPMDDAKRLSEQVAMVRRASNATHVWVYRNLVKARLDPLHSLDRSLHGI